MDDVGKGDGGRWVGGKGEKERYLMHRNPRRGCDVSTAVLERQLDFGGNRLLELRLPGGVHPSVSLPHFIPSHFKIEKGKTSTCVETNK